MIDKTQAVYEIVFSCANAFEDAHNLFSFGVECIEEISATQLRCYFSGKAQAFKKLVDESKLKGFKVDLISLYNEQNWVARCEELCSPLKINNLQIVPVVDPGEPKDFNRDIVYIVPGTGFGTGHHATTFMMLEMLQFKEVSSIVSERILDFGSGSGILAIAAKKLYNVQVEAIEIDPLAIVNLNQNIELNGLDGGITVCPGSVDCMNGSYDLILANVYAEILCQFEPEYYCHLAPDGFLVLSGIRQDLISEILECFKFSKWEVIHSMERDGWSALMLHKCQLP